MQKYALILAAHYTVMLYETYLEYQVGVCLETNDDKDYLQRLADNKNQEKDEEMSDYEEMLEDERRYDEHRDNKYLGNYHDESHNIFDGRNSWE